MLQDVPVIDQSKMMSVFRYGIKSESNILILGPSGGGKTHMAFQVIEEMGCRPVYINMAVLERTDFQGMPVISQDKSQVHYASADFLPFEDIKVMQAKKALNTVLAWAKKSEDKFNNKAEIVSILESELEILDSAEEVFELQKASHHLNSNNLSVIKNKIKDIKTESSKQIPLVFMFDEVDKAISEVLQTLLEFLQFHSINGRKMNIKSCILTGNLPDEHAHTNQISHAITKRCMTFKLELDFTQWRTWAIDNGISHLVTGFLTQHSSFLYKTAEDETAYALPSPRTWAEASKALSILENDSFGFSGEAKEQFRIILMSGCIGSTAAIQFNNWHKHYHELDPVINALLERGIFPENQPNDDTKKLSTEDIFICALSACSRIEDNLKPDNVELYTKYIKHTFNWFATLPTDVQIGSIRMIFGNNFDESKGQKGIIKQYKLAEIPEFTKVFVDITKNLKEHQKFNQSGGMDKFNSELDKQAKSKDKVEEA